MATGHQAYAGHTPGVVFEAILNRTPAAPVSLNSDLPQEFEHIVGKLLEKDRELRYQSAAEVRADLKRLRRDLVPSQVHEAAIARAGPVARSLLKYAAGITALLAVGVAFAVRYGPSLIPSSPPTITQISRWNKPMVGARLSPDGRIVAFGSPVHNVQQLFVMLTSGGDPLQLTDNEGTKVVDGFSPDGKQIYYSKLSGADEEWAVPALGGTPRRVAAGHSLVATPDDRTYFYLKVDSTAVFKAGTSGLGEEQVHSFKQPTLYPQSILLFPDATALLVGAVTWFLPPSEETHLVRINLRDQTGDDLGTISGSPTDLEWLEPGKTVIFSRTVNGLTNLWQYDLVGHTLNQITTVAGSDLSPMPDPLGQAIYYVNSKRSGLLTAYRVPDARSTEIVSDDVSQPAVSPAGKRVVYIKFIEPGGGQSEVLVSHIDGRNRSRLASGRGLVGGYWSADSSQVSFMEPAGQSSRAYLINGRW